MIAIAAGLRRTGSWAMWQVMREIVTVARVGWAPQANTKEFNANYKQWGNASEMVVLKFHKHRALLDNLSSSQVAAVMTVRDPRDNVVSLMNKYGYPFEMALNSTEFNNNLTDHDHWLNKLPSYMILPIRYEDFMTERVATIIQVANFLGQTLTEEQAQEIDETWSIERNRLRSQKNLAPDNYNYVAPRHITDGSVGQWKDVLTRDQAMLVEEKAEVWMIAYEYDSVEV